MKSRHRVIGSPTAAQQAYQDAQRAFGCAACRLRGNRRQPGPTEIHHRTVGDLHGNKQLGQHATVALCSWHHRGTHTYLKACAVMRDVYGPSLALNKREFMDWLQDVLGERSTEALQRWADQQIEGRKAA